MNGQSKLRVPSSGGEWVKTPAKKTPLPSAASKGRVPNKESSSLLRPAPHILVVDDDEVTRRQLKEIYLRNGYEVTCTGSAEDALTRLSELDVDLAVIDIRLPGMSGVELVRHVRENYPDVPVIVITGYGNINIAIDVLKLGASDFFAKPFSLTAIQESTRVVLHKTQTFMEIRHLRRSLKEFYNFGGIVSKSPAMHEVFETIRIVSDMDLTVLVEGETGTGKELVARTIHYNGSRRNGPFIALNCAGFPETLLESELFGYEKGAFTSADDARLGKIELANGGTLFLDEIESISLNMQAKLLRVLENRTVRRLGGSRAIKIDMRVIAASNIPLPDLVAQGRMRNDFYYRINVISIQLIPLRERLEDVPLLVQGFLHRHPVARRKGITRVTDKALACLMGYSWPGNIRELQNVLERAIAMEKTQVISKIDLPKLKSRSESYIAEDSHELPLSQWVREQEKQYLIRKLALFGGRIDLTAKNCRVGVRTLSRKMRLYGLDKRQFAGKTSDVEYDSSVAVPRNNAIQNSVE